MPQETVRTETTPEGETVVVRRRRSSHHRHRHHRRHRSEAAVRRRQDLRVLSFALPLVLLAVGFFVWSTGADRPGRISAPNPAMKELAWWMMGGGAALLMLALVVEWISKGIESIRGGSDETMTFSDGDGD